MKETLSLNRSQINFLQKYLSKIETSDSYFKYTLDMIKEFHEETDAYHIKATKLFNKKQNLNLTVDEYKSQFFVES